MEKQDMQLIIEMLAKAEANRKTDMETVEANRKKDQDKLLATMEAD
jgi:hypothetical protein